MESADLTLAQSQSMLTAVRRQLDYLDRLRRRMDATGFPPTDLLYQSTLRAFNAMQELSVRLHYVSSQRTRGRPPPK